jgi:CRP-like cAMP-binding protein
MTQILFDWFSYLTFPFLQLISGTKERVMFILNKGRVQIEKRTTKHGIRVTASLSDGSFFGEEALLFGTYRQETVRSLSFCNVCALNKDNVDEVLDKYPSDKKILKKILIKNMWIRLFKNKEFIEALATHGKKKGKSKLTNSHSKIIITNTTKDGNTTTTTPTQMKHFEQRLTEMAALQQEMINSMKILTSKVSQLLKH